MILIYIAIIIGIIGISTTIVGKVCKDRKVKLSGIFILLLLIIAIVLFVVYSIESEQEEAESQIWLKQNEILKVPDRIIYKNDKNEYFELNSENKNFATIYTEIFNRIDGISEGKVLTDEEIDNIKENGKFIEFDYYQKSKNFIFPLDEEKIGMIRMLTDSGQIAKTKLDNKDELVKMLNTATRKLEAYKFEKGNSYTSSTVIMDVPTGFAFKQKADGIYQLLIDSNEQAYNSILAQTDFKIDGEMPSIDFSNQNVIVTISKYEIKSIKENIGNIKYKFSTNTGAYKVNILVVSEIVNTSCIYCEIEGGATTNSIEGTTTKNESTNYITAKGIIVNTYKNGIEVGLTDSYLTHDIVIKDTTYIEDYTSNKEINIKDLKVGDSIYVEGTKIEPYNDLEKVEANRILICKKEKVKAEAEKYIKDTYRIDGLGIELKNVDSNGNGYIIVTYEYENFIYPIKLNVNSETETYLGMGYHLESNYGYILHEMSDITLDTKITDIDNIKGYVKMIEYIAD